MNQQAKHLYEFGPFRLDTVERQLRRDGAPVVLTPKVYDLLLVWRILGDLRSAAGVAAAQTGGTARPAFAAAA